ncbi:NUDIX domain-containing protein [Streptomyces sp. HO565]|uniref:NUDIX hydrolase n=1 Tax=Streptomyces sp. HO565 TaxID=2857489 RepID=UPI0034DC5BBA
MTSPVSPSDHVSPRAALPAAQYAASRHAAWLGAAAIITDEISQVLLVHPTYREDDSWLLPGGVVEAGEHPHVACRRETTEELGLDLPLSAVLAVHSFSPRHADLQPATACPGEVRFVFDGGTLRPDQVEAIRLPHEELSEYAFLETRGAVQRLRPVDGRIMLAAYRGRLGNTATAHLADGRYILDVPALGRHDVHVRYRPLWESPLNRGPVPGPLPVQQAWAWCFVPDGRVVLVADPGLRGALPMLPGGTGEKTDATPEDTLHREAAEEAQLTLTDPVRLGWVLDETGEVYGGVSPTPGSAWPPGSPPSGRWPSALPPATPSPACSPPRPGSRPAGLGPARRAANPARGGDGIRAVGPAHRSLRRHRGDPCGGVRLS